ncbi:MAG: FixG Ig-like domain-containing protein [Nanoarchaeota archaeon]
MKKLLCLIALLLVGFLTSLATNVNAQGYSFTEVEVNGVTMNLVTPSSIANTVNVERGDRVFVKAELRATANVRDVRVRTWIGGYEFGNIQEETEIFDVETNVTYVKGLILGLPEDLDASKDYTLHVEAFDDVGSTRLSFPLRVQEQRHMLNILDVIFNPGISVRNDQPLFVTVRIENLGDKKEEDIKVEVSLPSLGLSQKTFIDELSPSDDPDFDEEDSESSEALFLDLSNVKAGEYPLRVRVEYNRGHSFVEQTYVLTVQEAREVAEPTKFMAVVAERTRTLNAGSSTTYTLSLANLGAESRTFSLEVAGVEAFGSASVSPSLVLMPADSTREAVVTVNANQDATSGSKVFTVRVKEADSVVKELQLEANVQGRAPDTLAGVKSGLIVGFIVLLIVLVILGIILVVNKMKSKEGPEETYY